MTAGHRHRIDGLLAELVGELAQLVRAQTPQILGGVHLIEQGGLRKLYHATTSTKQIQSAPALRPAGNRLVPRALQQVGAYAQM
jgi:hypothetical protein